MKAFNPLEIKCLCIFGPLVETSSENLHFTLEIGFSEHVGRYLAKIYINRSKPSYRRFLEKGLLYLIISKDHVGFTAHGFVTQKQVSFYHVRNS